MSPRLTHSSLFRLQSKLEQTMSAQFSDKAWGATSAMSKVLADVKSQFDTAAVRLNERSIGKALLTFRNTGDLPTFIDLKYACFGLGQQVGRDHWSLIEDEERFPAFLKRVDKERPQPRRFRKCYQGLMHCYFSYDIFDNPTEVAKTNWERLQKYLRERLNIALSATNTPTWLNTLSAHVNLVSRTPCERYAAALLKGDHRELSEATQGIGVSSTSWLWQEAMLAHTQAVAKKSNDDEFRSFLKPLIDLLDGKGDIELSGTVVARCTADLLIRYTKCKEQTEHPLLRDLAVNHIGNPWLKRAAWDGYVKNEEARKMVDGWLKRRLITDFFALLSEDGSADTRRLNYWLRFEPVIEDMWFVLGTQARINSAQEFREMRRRMEGRLHYLGGGTAANNNAFVMNIGAFMVVEFGVTGNACYVFNAGDLRINPRERSLSINTLKGRQRVGWLTHMSDWESKFDEWILPRIGWKPPDSAYMGHAKSTSRGSVQRARVIRHVPESQISAVPDEYVKFLVRYGIAYEDKRPKGGALWALTDNRDPVMMQHLRRMGFGYVPGKGWWRE